MRALAPRHWANGRFEIVRELGAGGMGIVLEAIDREQHARVALKTLQSLDADSLLRFKKEFRALQDIQHPNLVRLGELFEDSGVWFFSMELVDGVDLFDYVCPLARARGARAPEPATTRSMTPRDVRAALLAGASPGPALPSVLATHAFDEERLRGTFLQLARALVALHGARKVHRDLKPSNLLVAADGRLVVLDFGVVADASEARDDGIVGTAAYMAPEQALGEAVGPAADWYGVGVVLFTVLTGRTPFVGTVEHLLAEKLVRPSPRPSALAHGVPDDLDALCVALLAIDPAARPRGDQVLRAFGVRTLPPASDRGPASEELFVGRAREMAAIRSAFAATRAGGASILLVSGESGVGKTALVREFLAGLHATDPDALVISGRCYERESVPYKAVDDAMDGVAVHLAEAPDAIVLPLVPRDVTLLARVFPVLRRVPAMAAAIAAAPAPAIADAQQLRMRSFAALRELLGALARARTLVLSIDDLQWADADSLALLAEVLAAPDPPPLFLLATVRTSREEGELRSLEQLSARLSESVRQLRVEPLPRDDAFALVQRLLADTARADGISADQIVAEAGGHPMFISALVRHGGRAADGGAWHLDDILWTRAAALEPVARALLRAVALAGAPLRQDVVADAIGLSVADFVRVTGALRGAQFVRTSGARPTDTIETYHDRVRESVVARLAPDEATTLHRGLATALAKSERPDPERLAIYWAGAGERARAAHLARVAADQAAQALAFEHAARLYSWALDLGAPEIEADVRRGLGDALANAGRGREAADAYLAGVTLAPARGAIELRRLAAEQLLTSGHIDRGLATLKGVLTELGLPFPGSLRVALMALLWRRAQLFVWLWFAKRRGWSRGPRRSRDSAEVSDLRMAACRSATVGLGMVDNVRGAYFQTRWLLLALDAGHDEQIATGLALEACFLAAAGSHKQPRVRELIAASAAYAGRIDEAYPRAMVHLATGVSAVLDGRWRDGLRAHREALALFGEHCTGVAWETETAKLMELWALWFCGDLRLLWRLTPLYRHQAEARGDLFASTNLRGAWIPDAWLARDEAELARADADRVLAAWSHQGFHLQHWYAVHAHADIALYEGRGIEARRALLPRLKDARRALIHLIQLTRLTMNDLVGRSAIAAALETPLDAREPLLREALGMAALLERERHRAATPLARVLRAGVASVRGDPRHASDLLARAREGLLAADMDLHAEVVELRLGQLEASERGGARVEAAERALQARGVVRLDRFAALLAPGSWA